MLILPVLTYCVAPVNRFVVGYLVVMKLTFMITTYLFKNGNMELITMFLVPVVVGIIAGIIFALWFNMAVLPFVITCSFLGASYAAPNYADIINRIMAAVQRDPLAWFDPVDFIFNIFKIELTDGWTLLFMVILMAVSIPLQLSSIKEQGFSYDTPIITYETTKREQAGKIKRR